MFLHSHTHVEVPILMGSPKVQQHPQAHACPREPTHSQGNLPYNFIDQTYFSSKLSNHVTWFHDHEWFCLNIAQKGFTGWAARFSFHNVNGAWLRGIHRGWLVYYSGPRHFIVILLTTYMQIVKAGVLVNRSWISLFMLIFMVTNDCQIVRWYFMHMQQHHHHTTSTRLLKIPTYVKRIFRQPWQGRQGSDCKLLVWTFVFFQCKMYFSSKNSPLLRNQKIGKEKKKGVKKENEKKESWGRV